MAERSSSSFVFRELTSSPTADKFKTFDENQVLESERLLLAETSNSDILEFCQFLINDYPFGKLLLKDDSKRKLFAFAMAQCWLFTRTNIQVSGAFSFLNCFASPLSVILNSEYKLVIDEVEIIETLTRRKVGDILNPKPSKTPVDYEKRFFYWNFLRELKDSPICELKTLILVTNAMSIQTHLLEFSRISADKCVASGIEYLNKRGLLLSDVPETNLLAIFPIEKLKRFAGENGLEEIPPRKDDVINLIKEKCDPKATSDFVKFLLNDPQYGYGYAKEIFMLPSIPNAKIFQEYIRSELNRFGLYLEFIGCIEHKHHTVISPIMKRNQPGDRPGDPFLKLTTNDNNERALYPRDSIDRVTPADLRIIQKYWDENCNTLLSKVKDKNLNSFPVGQLVSEIMSYWEKSGILNKYKLETCNSAFETHWHWLLNSYSAYLLGSDEKYQLKPTNRTCNGCGKVFKEWSITLDFALRVGNRIEFCYSCYSYIFNHQFMANTTKAAQMPEKEMQDYLFELSKALGFIPTRIYMENVKLPAEPVEKQIRIGKLLLHMPAYEIYIEKFGNWLKSLMLAGVLDDGHRKTSRGIQCLASDGHLCLSLAEKAIDDWLSNHNVPHEKESLYPFDEELNPNKLSRVDWKIGNIFIEYAGLMNDNTYAHKMKIKTQLAEKSGFILIIIEPVDLFSLDEKLVTLFL